MNRWKCIFNRGRSENDMKRAAHIEWSPIAGQPADQFNAGVSKARPVDNADADADADAGAGRRRSAPRAPAAPTLALLAAVAMLWPARAMAAISDTKLPPQPAAASAGADPASGSPTVSPNPVAVRLQNVHAIVFRDNGRPAVTLSLDLAGDYTYTPSNSGSRLLIVDLPGAVTDQDAASHLLASPLVSSYRVTGIQLDGLPALRLEVLLKAPAVADYRRSERGLEMRLTAAPSSASALAPSASSSASALAPPASSSASVTPAVTPVSAARASRLEKVQLSGSGDSTSVAVTANGAVEFKAFELRGPHRLVVDIPDVVNQAGKQPLVATGPSPLRVVRVGQFRDNPPVTRVVLELDDTARYDVHRGARGLEIEVRSASAAPKKDQPAYAATPASPSSHDSILPASSSAVLANMQQSSAAPKEDPAPAPSSAKALDMPAAPEPVLVPRSTVHAPAEENIAPAAPATPPATPGVPMAVAAPSPTPTPSSASALAQPAPVQQSVPMASATPGRLAVPLMAQQAMPAPQGAVMSQSSVGSAKRYAGEPISINVKDVDLKDFFRLIQEISGLNVILDPGVNGRLTMTLNDVPWDQALDIVLRNFQLDYQLQGNVMRITTIDQVAREQKAAADMVAAQQDAVERVTVTRDLSYSKASELMPTLRKFLTKRGDLVAYDRTNQLIITDTPAGIAVADSLLAQLDKQAKQVEIEARVVAASRQFTEDWGTQLGFAFGSGNSIVGGNPVGGNSSPIIRTPPPLFTSGGGQSVPLFSNFPAAGTDVGAAYALFNPHFDLDFILTAAEQKGTGKLLSRPKIITQNNRPGKVQQGVQIPIQTTVNNTVSLQMLPVTLSMTVTPQITSDGTILMDIDVTNSTIDPGIPRINGTPALDTQEATTSVLVPDGGTVVFGGVVQNQNNLTIQQVPVLGSIPILGNLFKRTAVSTTTTELIFFVTPKIL